METNVIDVYKYLVKEDLRILEYFEEVLSSIGPHAASELAFSAVLSALMTAELDKAENKDSISFTDDKITKIMQNTLTILASVSLDYINSNSEKPVETPKNPPETVGSFGELIKIISELIEVPK